MPLNPKRILTKLGKQSLLESFSGADAQILFTGRHMALITSVTVDPREENLSDIVLPTGTFGAFFAIEEQSAFAVSGSGKMYVTSGLSSWVKGAAEAPVTVVGVAIFQTAALTYPLCYLELDEAKTYDELNETIELRVEIGFDGHKFYIEPRVMPTGE